MLILVLYILLVLFNGLLFGLRYAYYMDELRTDEYYNTIVITELFKDLNHATLMHGSDTHVLARFMIDRSVCWTVFSLGACCASGNPPCELDVPLT